MLNRAGRAHLASLENKAHVLLLSRAKGRQFVERPGLVTRLGCVPSRSEVCVLLNVRDDWVALLVLTSLEVRSNV
jgi:hypothetical protein